MIMRLLSLPLNFQLLFRDGFLVVMVLVVLGRVNGGIFGISIPANYGQWFGQIYQIYMDNQDLITNARRAYMAYQSVSDSVNGLKEMGLGDQEVFKDRWRRNMQALLASQIWFAVDEAVWDGPNGTANQLVTELLGLRFGEDGRVAIDPNLIQGLALQLTADRSYWEQVFLNTEIPTLPSWFMTRTEYYTVSWEYVNNQTALAYTSFKQALQDRIHTRIMEDLAQNPTWFLSCESSNEDCYSPFSFAATSGVPVPTWSWDETVAMMFDRNHPVHNPNPLPGELVLDGNLIVAYDAYFHRRVCSVVWRQMGIELREKLTRVHSAFRAKCHELNAAIYDVEYLVKFLEDSMTPLMNWDPSSDNGMAMTLATALDIMAGGAVEEQATRTSFFQGGIRMRLNAALTRSREVKRRLQETDALFVNLLRQIEAKAEQPSVVDGLVQRNFAAYAASMRSTIPPHNYLGKRVMARMAAKIHAHLEAR